MGSGEYLKHYTSLWGLVPDRESFFTHFSSLRPVRFEGIPAMIKISMEEEEKMGALLMRWWNEIRVLHGDIHHGNVLYNEHSGWIAIDPKGLIGERGFDYANILQSRSANGSEAGTFVCANKNNFQGIRFGLRTSSAMGSRVDRALCKLVAEGG